MILTFLTCCTSYLGAEQVTRGVCSKSQWKDCCEDWGGGPTEVEWSENLKYLTSVDSK